MLTHQELLVGYPAVPVLVCVHEHLPDLCVGDVLGQVRHHLPEVRQPEGPLGYLVLLGSVLDGVRVRAADVLHNPCEMLLQCRGKGTFAKIRFQL